MKKIFLASVLLLAACATVEPVYMKDGVQVYRSTCNGAYKDIGDCYALASQQCAGSFEVINSIEDSGPSFYSSNKDKMTTYFDDFKTSDSNNFGWKGKFVKRTLFFYCKN